MCLMCTHACAAHTSDEAAGGVLVDSGYVDNGAGLVGIPAEKQDHGGHGKRHTERSAAPLQQTSSSEWGQQHTHVHTVCKVNIHTHIHTYECTAIQVICPNVRCGVVRSPRHCTKLLAYLKVLSDSS